MIKYTTNYNLIIFILESQFEYDHLINEKGLIDLAPYLFVVAALFLSICTIILFLTTLTQLKREPDTYQTVMPKFMMKVFAAEVIPIGLIVYGFTLKHQVAHISELYVPFAILISIIVITSIIIFLRARVDVEEAQRAQIMTFGFIAIAFANAISIIGIVALLTMV